MEDAPQHRSGGARPEEQHQGPATPGALGRRKFLLGAAVAGSAAWAVPAIVTMEPAGAAALTSPPPTPPEVEVEGEQVVDPPVGPAVEVAAAKPSPEPEVEVKGALAVTGAPIDTLLGAGAAAIAGGGALHQWSARAGRRRASAAGAADSTVEPGITDPPVG